MREVSGGIKWSCVVSPYTRRAGLINIILSFILFWSHMYFHKLVIFTWQPDNFWLKRQHAGPKARKIATPTIVLLALWHHCISLIAVVYNKCRFITIVYSQHSCKYYLFVGDACQLWQLHVYILNVCGTLLPGRPNGRQSVRHETRGCSDGQASVRH